MFSLIDVIVVELWLETFLKYDWMEKQLKRKKNLKNLSMVKIKIWGFFLSACHLLNVLYIWYMPCVLPESSSMECLLINNGNRTKWSPMLSLII